MPTTLRLHIARVLLCALVVAALAPDVARALAVAQGSIAPWSVLCGSASQALQSPLNEPTQPPAQWMEHCAWCSVQGDAMAPPPAATAWLGHPPLPGRVPALWLHAPRPLPDWASAPARGPPPQA